MTKTIEKVCVFCASSTKADKIYNDSAEALGNILAGNNIAIVYGGGESGLMGHLANGALRKNGEVIGIIPDFMHELEWGHPGITRLTVVDSMHERKVLMRADTDAAIALPGGTGTLEELLEVITLKRLGMYLKPIIIVNVNNFYSPFLDLFDHIVKEKFMDIKHKNMFTVIDKSEDIIDAILDSPDWDKDSRHFAVM